MTSPDASPETDPRLLRLDPRDNVLTLTVPLAAGTVLTIHGRAITLSCDLALGHKLAACDLPRGGKVIKYGAPIGSTTADVGVGEHVHTHNLRSDYLPTVLHGTQEEFFDRSHAQ